MYSKDIYLVIPSDFFTMAVFLNQTFRVSTQSFLCFFWIRPSVFRPSPSYIFFESDLPCFDPILLMLFFLIRPPVFRPSPSWFFFFLFALSCTFRVLTQSSNFIEADFLYSNSVLPIYGVSPSLFWVSLSKFFDPSHFLTQTYHVIMMSVLLIFCFSPV